MIFELFNDPDLRPIGNNLPQMTLVRKKKRKDGRRIDEPLPSGQFDGKKWEIINSDCDWAKTSETCWMTDGGNFCEYFDTQSPKMLALKQAAEKACTETSVAEILFSPIKGKAKSVQEILKIVNKLVNEINSVPHQSYEETDEAVDKKFVQYISKRKVPSIRWITDAAGNQSPVVDMAASKAHVTYDELMDEKILQCRHKAAIEAAILAHLVAKGILPAGKIRYYATYLANSEVDILQHEHDLPSHAFVLFRESDKHTLWLSDPRWRQVQKLDHASCDKAAGRGYGKLTVQDMISRMDCNDILPDFFAKMQELKLLVPAINEVLLHRRGDNQPGMELRLKGDPTAISELSAAFSSQGIKHFSSLNNEVLIIRAENNPHLSAFRCDKFLLDYNEQRQQHVKKSTLK